MVPHIFSTDCTAHMRKLTATICLTIAVLLGSAGMSWSADIISNETKNFFRVYLNDFDREFNKVPMGETFFPDRNGYKYQKQIVAVPNRRIPKEGSDPVADALVAALNQFKDDKNFRLGTKGYVVKRSKGMRICG